MYNPMFVRTLLFVWVTTTCSIEALMFRRCKVDTEWIMKDKVCEIDRQLEILTDEDAKQDLKEQLSSISSSLTFLMDTINKLKDPTGQIKYTPEAAKSCPSTFVSYKSRCYKVFDVLESWIDAKMHCKMFGADLLVLDSIVKTGHINREVRKNPHASRGKYGYWINGADFMVEGEWRWFDGKDGESRRIVYTNWAHRMPDNAGGIEHCLEISYNYGFEWNDAPCGAVNRFICETK